ncbi:type IV toxin-antitoxin system AbiEi family antitoxin [Paraburkholderia solisilvae]|uniref:Uncharacterized protein n=1 Tax=Paraburkholderia solisilvae TaxID=624376 RepID=A0A6J5DLK4_9BURK|nr:type IV toxin-antitoxin system AbiEi family antitoxin [Paraburkholderia solisilvae]CAB3753895.1 hypothetical protein LMG29739_01819 [Paraburkholderia solisilvae]
MPSFTPSPIIEAATLAFSGETGVPTSIGRPAPDTPYDAIVEFDFDTPVARPVIVVPSIDRQERLAAVSATAKLQSQDRFLLVTSYLTPALVEACRDLDLDAIDLSGNAFVKERKNLVFVAGRPRAVEASRSRLSMWTKRSMQVILALLVRPDLLNAGRRDAAIVANVSTGTAHTTIQTLLKRRDLVERADGTLAFANFERLLDEWVTLYPSILRPSLGLGRYRATKVDWWADLTSASSNWMLGGEAAAALLTRYLKPAVVTVYCKNDVPKELVRHGRLRPDPSGEVEFLTAPIELRPTPNLVDNVVSPVLVYADLIASGDSRNVETARMIREQFIAR